MAKKKRHQKNRRGGGQGFDNFSHHGGLHQNTGRSTPFFTGGTYRKDDQNQNQDQSQNPRGGCLLFLAWAMAIAGTFSTAIVITLFVIATAILS